MSCRLANPPNDTTRALFEGQQRKWELVSKVEVESRLGYPVTELPCDEDWRDLDVSSVAQWVCIPATIQYTICSDVYRCEGLVTIEEPTGKTSTRGKNAGKPMVRRKRVPRGCGKQIVLWEAAVDERTREVSETFVCPHCALEWKKVQIRREPAVAVKTSIEYCGLEYRNGKPQEIIRTVMRRVTRRENTLAEAIGKGAIETWVPTVRFDKAGPQYRRNALLCKENRLRHRPVYAKKPSRTCPAVGGDCRD